MTYRLRIHVPQDESVDRAVEGLVDERFASRLFDEDGTLWGPEAESEASIRLSWVTLHESSRALVPDIVALRDDLRSRGITRVVLCGMGGSSLAPEVICAAAGVPLDVLDSSNPDMVRSAIRDLESTVVVVSSKSGGTVETDSQRRIFEQAFTDAGLDPSAHLVIVTDPGSPLDEEATAAGYRVFRADPHVGGRYSALTAFGLVPSGIAGADIATLLDQAGELVPELSADETGNPGLRLGTALGVAAQAGVDKVVLYDRDQHGLGDWIEQLVAESTGKEDTGILPVVALTPDDPFSPDEFVVHLGTAEAPGHPWAAGVEASLGAQFLIWEVATAVAGRLLSIDPFDQPDVESAKAAARELLGGEASLPAPDHTGELADIYGSSATTIADAIAELLGRVGEHDYLALQFYLDRWALAGLESLAPSVAGRISRPVTFGWGPRFLHSTGQYHKGGTPRGVFLQVTADPVQDVSVPGRDFTLGQFIVSQAAGDASVLRDKGRPVLRLHLHDVEAGLAAIKDALA
ncbi:glucose-6-phosphate isomerase [Aeromicrobium duanguangcaii]|uniref:Glucose-6-phosphate isomerase n=1 Tax=Aeromicrobium duanguangcaii TaxID=2968086 RepID=A0ABY5KFY9_9ACTN|nr:glucose-6-phosphate isomerase [Aeromicrobium duanguangcaii]UUI67313.1 glucose-6-phosphate isomerase [Aeromicrobium duanguangcaii]